MKIRSTLLAVSLALPFTLAAQYNPVPLTPDSFNHDIVVEATALRSMTNATTASMDTGITNTAFGWYEQGFNLAAPATGLPTAGSTVASVSQPDHTFTFAPSYTTSNAFLIDTAVTNAAVALTAPGVYSTLSFLASSGAGNTTVGYTLQFADGSTESGTFIALDWFNGAGAAVVGAGRLNVLTRGFDSVNSGNPKLFAIDVPVTNSTATLTGINLSLSAGTGHAAIFAVSGSTGGSFNPVAITGYNQDMVVEATSARNLGATTASMDAGSANTGTSWYEMGYNTNAPTTGMPAAGSLLTNASASDHVYRLASSYQANNALFLDAGNLSGRFTPITPTAVSALSFLTAAGGGSPTINYTINHLDGSIQGGTFISRDWFNNTPVAFTNNGRVNVVNGTLGAVNSGNPRLYAVDIVLTNTSSPVTSIDLSYGTTAGRAAIFALSGTAGAVRPIISVQPVSTNVALGGTVSISASASGTEPLAYQWQMRGSNGFFNVANNSILSGVTTSTITFTGATLTNAGAYILIASNAAGSSTSSVVYLNVITNMADVTAPGDLITLFNGSTPANETVTNAIDNTTTKYLNFGTDSNTVAPFVGPVGLTVTPALGSTLVTGLRIYTANDGVERDPIDYTLEGSVDGISFRVISSGALSLPDNRNAPALPHDPLLDYNQQILFSNSIPYTTYRLTFNNVKNNSTANSLQIGEVELLGEAAAALPFLSIAREGNGTVRITSSQAGTLQAADSLNSTNVNWGTVGPINGSVTQPTTGTARFFRVIVP